MSTNETSLTEQQPGQVAQPHSKKTFQQLVESDQFKTQIMAALPKTLTVERFIRVLMTATIKTPKLLECTQESMFQSIFSCAAIGLEIDGRRAALVPLKNRKKQGQPLEANLWIMYQGIAELVMRSGLVSNIHADLVCDKDEFEYDRGILAKHTINYREDRGEPYAAYSIIRMRDGSEKVEVMSMAEIERIRLASPGAEADAWRLNWGEMAKKTVFKRAAKWVPLSAETRDAIEKEDDLPATNVTGTGAPAAALPAGTPPPETPQAETPPTRPKAPAREKKGAAAVKENKAKTVEGEFEDVPGTPPTQEPSQGEPPAGTKTEAKPRAVLKADEQFVAVCEVVSAEPMMLDLDDVDAPSAFVKLKGEFEGEVYHHKGGTGTPDAPALLPIWTVGKKVRATLFGRSFKGFGIRPMVMAVEPAVKAMVMK